MPPIHDEFPKPLLAHQKQNMEAQVFSKMKVRVMGGMICVVNVGKTFDSQSWERK